MQKRVTRGRVSSGRMVDSLIRWAGQKFLTEKLVFEMNLNGKNKLVMESLGTLL
jgi:hypothetical protein